MQSRNLAEDIHNENTRVFSLCYETLHTAQKAFGTKVAYLLFFPLCHVAFLV